MILDTIDLKNNNWTPRNSVIKPKMLNEIEEEFMMASNNNRTISKCILPPEKLENYLKSSPQNVIKTISNV